MLAKIRWDVILAGHGDMRNARVFRKIVNPGARNERGGGGVSAHGSEKGCSEQGKSCILANVSQNIGYAFVDARFEISVTLCTVRSLTARVEKRVSLFIASEVSFA